MNYSPMPKGLLPKKTLDSNYLQLESKLGKIIDLKVERQETLAR